MLADKSPALPEGAYTSRPVTPNIIPLLQATKSNFTLAAVIVYLLCSLAAAFFKKEKYAVRIGVFLAIVCLCGLIVVRVFPVSAESTNGHVQVEVQGNGNGTAVGDGNSVNVSQPGSEGSQKE